MLNTVNMLNGQFRSAFSGFNFLASEPMSVCGSGQAR